MTDLLPCPFCGGKAVYETKPAFDFGCRDHWVRCVKCFAKGEGVYEGYADKRDCAAIAREKWNTRHEAAKRQPVVDEEAIKEALCDSFHNFEGYWRGTKDMALSGPQLRGQMERQLDAIRPYLAGKP